MVDGMTSRVARLHIARELVFVVVLLQVYRLVRYLARDQEGRAYANARRVIAIEQDTGLFTEHRVQDLLIAHRYAVRFFNSYYLSAHFTTAVVVLVALYVWRHDYYLEARRVLAAMTGAALVIHVVFPLAPPRMMPMDGFIDTGIRFGPSAYGASGTFHGVANQFAAMPSMHFGWALVVAWVLVRASDHPARWLIVAHPALTLVAIVGTANHYWLDALVALALFAVAVKVQQLAAPPTLVSSLRPSATSPLRTVHRTPAVAARSQPARE